jgi:hypothetical protein
MLYAKRWSPRSIARHANEVGLPPLWVGEDRVSKKGWAELGDGLVAPEVMDEGAIDPWRPYLVAPVGGCKQPADGVYSPPMLMKGTTW